MENRTALSRETKVRGVRAGRFASLSASSPALVLTLLGSVLVPATLLPSCEATRSADGGVTVRFAPDMVLTVYGLEDSLSKFTDLLASCMNGTFPRACTDKERADVMKAIENVLEAKSKYGEDPGAGTP